MARRPSQRPPDAQQDLFSTAGDPTDYLRYRLSTLAWPDPEQFPVNHALGWTRQLIWNDLSSSDQPLLVAGFSSLDELIELAAGWGPRHAEGQLRVVLGSEPFTTQRTSFTSSKLTFTAEVRDYWTERGISLRQSAKLLAAIELIESGRLAARIVAGTTRLHAKIYRGDHAATVGSSNFTHAGLIHQAEANARFSADTEPGRYRDLGRIAENYWDVGEPWDHELVELLHTLLSVVPWQEALARAAGELLEGEWAARYVAGDHTYDALWPSQQLGIAQALWIAENVGSVLVADATGSGKTRMGAHLVRALRDRLWATGRVRNDLTAVVSPPAVLDTWRSEALGCGVSIAPVSHGRLSRDHPDSDLPRDEQVAVATAQILAIDEAHNFLNDTSKRTRRIHDNFADHVVLFTATPINRDARDLLQLVGLLGADNFADDTLDILDRLEHRRRSTDPTLSNTERDQLRREIQRFTVRRTKTHLNELVATDPAAYTDPTTGQLCRYPDHESHTYPTGETSRDAGLADAIRDHAQQLDGLTYLGRHLEVPEALRADLPDDRWLELRLSSARGLAGHRVLAALRSSRAALVEHLAGTTSARDTYQLDAYKAGSTGNVIATLDTLTGEQPPTHALTCDLPDWLTDPTEWAARVHAELDRYHTILELAEQLSDAREGTKAALLAELARHHDRVLAFDRHPVTLAVLEQHLTTRTDVEVIVATGSNEANRRRVRRLFQPDSTTPAIALCSDAMNEGLNLQGASAIVHLDLPTTLRVVEQRVGRVDRMNSPHQRIEAWWPDDGPSFITRANELLTQRAEESAALLGSNLTVPGTRRPDDAIDLHQHISELDHTPDPTWDGIRDALDPVRQLVTGDTALISARTYRDFATSTARVLARVAPVTATTPWVFLSIAATSHGAPRWLFIDGQPGNVIIDLDDVATHLRARLADNPPNRALDTEAVTYLTDYLQVAADHETELLPRRHRRALAQMRHLTAHWATHSPTVDEHTQWTTLGQLATPNPGNDYGSPDPYLVAQRWLELVRPTAEQQRRGRRRRRYSVLGDITPTLEHTPLPLEQVRHAMSGLELAAPLDQRVTACILGIPTAR